MLKSAVFLSQVFLLCCVLLVQGKIGKKLLFFCLNGLGSNGKSTGLFNFL